MATNGFVYALIIVVLLETAVANCQNCDFSSNVSLSTMEENICPMQPVTVQCNVTKPSDGGNFILSWQCTGLDGTNEERLAFCETGPVAGFSCKFGEVYNVKGSCTCNETQITSEATFIATSVGDMLLFCSDGGVDTQEVLVSVKGLDAPLLSMNYTAVIIDSETYEVIMWWTSGNYTPDDVEYVVSFTNSKEIVTNTTNQTHISQILYRDTEYIVTVTAQRCGGNLSSKASNRLPIIAEEAATSTQVTITATPKPTGPTESTESSNTAAIVGGTVSSVVAVGAIFFIISTIIAIYYWLQFQKKVLQSDEVDSPKNVRKNYSGEDLTPEEVDSPTVVHEYYAGEDLTDEERSKFIITNEDKKCDRTAAGAVYVEEDYIYFSCKEQWPKHEEHTLRKFNHESVFVLSISGFNHIRGIGKDNDGNFYVSDSLNYRVLKFDKDWNPIQKISFKEPMGILVDADYVYVCLKRKNHICVLDHSLSICYTIRLSFSPIDITKFDDKYFVTTFSAIVMLDINLSEGTLNNIKLEKMTKDGSESVPFRRCELRGICASDKYLYVTEDDSSGHLLCLEFHNNSLKYISETKENHTPCATAYSGGSVYYSEGVPDDKFFIRKVTGQQSLTDTVIIAV